SRVALVTRSNAAELEATGRKDSVLWLGIYSNRYCFALFAPLTIFLLTYGTELIRLWISPEVAEHSAPLLPILAPVIALVMAGQYNSSAILYGIGKHQRYAQSVLAEAAIVIAGMWFVIPRYGIWGAAVVSSAAMVLSRGLFTPWLVCNSLDFPFPTYMRQIYWRPLLAAAPVWALALLLKPWLTGNGWGSLIAGGACISISYLAIAVAICVEPAHRAVLASWVKQRRLKAHQ
ncbi:MAG: oligosaccharide flippase family protein, partial [Bryobacteraceae bacterium]